MKNLLLKLIILFIPVCASAQKYSLEDRAKICARIDTLMQNYMQKSGLTLPGISKRNDKVVGDLRAMLKPDAEIFDDINATYNEQTHQYELKTKARNTYIEELVDRFPKGLIITNNNLNINYQNFEKDQVSAVLSRSVQGVSADKYSFYNEDTLLLTIQILTDRSVKIVNIAKVGSNLKCLNDKDTDGVIDESDECPEKPGLISLNGCPDQDGDGLPDEKDDCPEFAGPKSNGGCPESTFAYQFVFSGGIGYQLNNNKIKAEDGTIGYPGLDEGASSTLPQVNHISGNGSLVINANIAYYFGKSKVDRNIGVSLGFTATNYTARYEIKNVKYVYTGSYIDQSQYKRIVTLRKGYEDLSFSILNFPLMLKYKAKMTSKIAFELGAGVSLVSFISNLKSSSTATFDFEGVEESIDWNNTGAGIESHMFNPDANLYFDSLGTRGYDFALNKDVKPETATFTKYKLGYNASADLFYHITKNKAIKLGMMFTYSPSKEKNSGYQMVNATEDSYKSVYSSNVKTSYTALAFNVGIIIGLNINRK